ncbi:MAG: ribonuclease H-like domain-containing protein [Deltaproteobacteria bacterium]|nr:ribonuclease H-like domain-containing protein [Deltaproteobacteria bacterium]
MLFHTFLHVPGVGERLERLLWNNKIFTWDDFLASPKSKQLFGRKYRATVRYIEKSKKNIDNISFFKRLLPSQELWRLYYNFREKAACLDIESIYKNSSHEITVIGLYGRGQMKSFIRGQNIEAFKDEISSYDLIITYNGICFDLPVLRKKLEINFPHAHIDLRFFLKRLGFTGGLKGVEKQFGISRSKQIDGLSGYDAVLLWRKYAKGNHQALDTLVEYNTCDTKNLKYLMDESYKIMFEKIFPQNGKPSSASEDNSALQENSNKAPAQ